jgi:PPOX class probable F420-dependent enzyme
MSLDARQAFLADVHVGIIAIEAGDGPPLAVPIWYQYDPGGEVRVHTGRESVKFRLLERAGRFTLTAQEESLPYRYVSVEGPITTIEQGAPPEERRALAHRYLGPELGDRYLQDTQATADDTMVVGMRPDRWRTVDYGRT